MPELEPRPAISSEPISVILVAPDGKEYLKAILDEWIKLLNKRKQAFEILVVVPAPGEGSSPPEDSPSGQENVKLFYQEKPGFGAAVRTGIQAAQYPLVCYCTADDQYDPADLQKMLQMIDQFDMVTGFRAWQKPPRWMRIGGVFYRMLVRVALGIPLEPWPCWLGWSGMGRRWFIRWVFGVYVQDAQCAFRLFRRDVLQPIPIQSDGSFASSEIMAKINFLGCYIGEIPVTYHPPQAQTPVAGSALERPSWREILLVMNHPIFKTRPPAEEPAKPEEQTGETTIPVAE